MSNDPVVSSRFGQRPLLEVPAMQVSKYSHTEVPSLQAQYPDPVSQFPYSNPNPGFVNPHPGYMTAGAMPPPPPVNYGVANRPYGTAPANPYQGRQLYYGPNGEILDRPPVSYPGVHNPFVRNIPPPNMSQGYSPPMVGFRVACDLEYGRIVNMNVRETMGEFRGIPDFIRSELMKTYGSFPFTHVNIRLDKGEFHIFAEHNDREGRGGFDDHDRYNRYERDDESDYDTRRDDHSSGLSDGIRIRERRPRRITHERNWDLYR